MKSVKETASKVMECISEKDGLRQSEIMELLHLTDAGTPQAMYEAVVTAYYFGYGRGQKAGKTK